VCVCVCVCSESVWGVLSGQVSVDSCPSAVMHDVRELETWMLRLLSAPVPVPGKTRVEVWENPHGGRSSVTAKLALLSYHNYVTDKFPERQNCESCHLKVDGCHENECVQVESSS